MYLRGKSNLILGGTVQSYSAKVLDDSVVLRRSNDDGLISNEARVILCTLLCQDLHCYAKVLHYVANLLNIDRTESWQKPFSVHIVTTHQLGIFHQIFPFLKIQIEQSVRK